ncbi:hypothetical protein [Actinoplanes sp. NPDC026623]|uniref:hypothetical protein n=1 Tax=Actinoplanes sp. NPDC026623 TaxID=3155610 RepID=UPI0033E88C9F
MGVQVVRFRDPTSVVSLHDLGGYPIDVMCPRCTGHALLVPDHTDPGPTKAWSRRRFVCPACALTGSWSWRGQSLWWGGVVDPFFGQPLWLTTRVRGHLLWALNRKHLDLLEQFVAAGLRERGPNSGLREHVTSQGWNMSLIERLPLWMKSARSRDDVLAAVARLRARLGDTGR